MAVGLVSPVVVILASGHQSSPRHTLFRQVKLDPAPGVHCMYNVS